ncbi:MAG: L,D-transpeptidase family protein [Schwartzia sp.]|nr:L,D-transpeptidase family protein [Schwartzia sp. (in: firmicutes)]
MSSQIGKLGGTAKRMAALMAVLCLFGASQPVSAEAGEKITINLASRILTFWRNGQKVSMYPIAVGKLETQTPLGEFCVLDKEVDPIWVDPKDEKKRVESGEDNPLGYRWMGIGGHYGIHGTNRPDSIGEYVSNGCIRLWEENAEELYEMTDIGTPVEIDYERLVIERLADGRIAYYIYPDGYYRQYLDVARVKEGLAAFGVADFVTDADVAEKIAASDGEPTFLPDTLRIEINDLWVSGRALKQGRKIYIPVGPVSLLTKLPVTSNWDTMTLSTVNGAAQGEVFSGKWYFALDDAQKLFGLSGTVEKDSVLRLRSAAQASAQAQTEQNAAVKDDKAVKEQPAQDKVVKEQTVKDTTAKEPAGQKPAEQEPAAHPAALPNSQVKG